MGKGVPFMCQSHDGTGEKTEGRREQGDAAGFMDGKDRSERAADDGLLFEGIRQRGRTAPARAGKERA